MDTLCNAIVDLARNGDIKMSTSELYQALVDNTHGNRHYELWPQSPKGLTIEMRKLAPTLVGMGVECLYGRTGRCSFWEIRNVRS